VPYSLIERTAERGFLLMAQSLDIAVCAWGAIGGEMLPLIDNLRAQA